MSPSGDNTTNAPRRLSITVVVSLACVIAVLAILAFFGWAPWLAVFDSNDRSSGRPLAASAPAGPTPEREFGREVYLHEIIGLRVTDALKWLGYPDDNYFGRPTLVTQPSGVSPSEADSDLTVLSACVRPEDETLFFGVAPTNSLTPEQIDLKAYQRNHNDAGGIDQYELIHSQGCAVSVFSVEVFKTEA